MTAGAREPQLLYALDPGSWGRGLATEASTAVIDYAFDELGSRELLASTDPPNRASIRVMERLGMRFLEAARAGGLPIVFYRIDREEWARRRGELRRRCRRRARAPRDDAPSERRRSATYREQDFAAVEAIWTALFPATAPYHAPDWSIRSMVAHAPDLFFVAEIEGEVVGTVLAGWDGHRGWIYSLGVRPDLQRGGIGSALLEHAVEALRARGCPKVNLQVRGDNPSVVGFYVRQGWSVEDRVSMGLVV